jgi:cytochrome b561
MPVAIVRYDPVAQVFHWVVAIAVVAAYALGLVREEMPRGEFRSALLSLHMSLGLLVFGLSVLRFVWRTGLSVGR